MLRKLLGALSAANIPFTRNVAGALVSLGFVFYGYRGQNQSLDLIMGSHVGDNPAMISIALANHSFYQNTAIVGCVATAYMMLRSGMSLAQRPTLPRLPIAPTPSSAETTTADLDLDLRAMREARIHAASRAEPDEDTDYTPLD